MILLSTLGVIRPLFVAADLSSEIKSDPPETANWNRESLVDSNGRKTHLTSLNHSNNCGAVDVKMNGCS